MSLQRVLRFEIPGREALGRIAAAQLPPGIHEESTDLDFFRIIHFDTETHDLERKGASVRLCIRPDETQTLVVNVGRGEGGEAPGQRHAEAQVPLRSDADLFSGESEPARLIRALVDPSHLKPSFELETVRRVRHAKLDSNGAAHDIRFIFDMITVRRGEVSGDLDELEVVLEGDSVEAAEGLVETVERSFGVRFTLADTAARARALLENARMERLEQNVRAAREVAVVAYAGGRIALNRLDSRLVLPTGHGAGQEACRRVLRRMFGKPHGRIRLLGTSAGSEERPALEVWLAEEVQTGSSECTWLPLELVLEHVGKPQLRDGATLAALHTVARSELAGRAQTERPADGPTTSSIFDYAVSATRARALLDDTKPGDVPPELLINPEVSRLAFDERILVIAEDEETPLLERVRFLSMFGSRIDDFFMTRIAEFKGEVAAGVTDLSLDGLAPGAQLDLVRVRARHALSRAYSLLCDTLLPRLEQEGIRILRWDDLDEESRVTLRRDFTPQAEAVITPVIADPTHPFPHMRNLRPAIAAIVRLPESVDQHFVAIQLPSGLPRFVPVPGRNDFVPLEEVILATLPRLYSGMEVVEAGMFRITRSAVIDLDNEPAGGILAALEDEVSRRPFGEAVRLEVERGMSESLRERLLRELQFEIPDVHTLLTDADVYLVDRIVDLAALKELADIERPELRWQPIVQETPLDDRPIFEQLAEKDVLVQFPYDSFEDTVERFLEEAAEDPDVESIKITLYRTNPASRLVQALAKARAAGKDAFALVELKASFDERRNIEWARALQAAGIHVVFSPSRIKVHAKTALVVRREGDTLRRYAYIGTGNLNSATARAYTDIGILTADPDLTGELSSVFNVLTGYSGGAEFEHLLVSPFTMRARFVEMVEREIEHARAGRGGHIRIQMNGLADRRMIAALYRASHAGVKIDMMVREICCLRPGIEGISENIRVTSLLGRFLQHMRIYCFHNAGKPEYFLGSADWRPRNLSKRVEVVMPVRDPDHCSALDEILTGTLTHPDLWELRADGAYVRGDEVIG